MHKRRVLLGLAATVMATVAMGGTASAGVLAPTAANCDDAAASRVFLPWLDGASYSLAPGGDAEGATTGWTLAGGAKVASGNEPWTVAGRDDARSFSIPAGGSITNISSVAGKLLPGGAAAYAASKAGLQALTAAMAREVAPHGIRVNAICVGIIDTSRMDDIPRGQPWDDLIRRNVPLGRAGTGVDIANMVVFLASEPGAWITGQSYNVDGGQVVAH